MRLIDFPILVRLRFVLLALFCLFGALCGTVAQTAAKVIPPLDPSVEVDFPKHLGEIVYQNHVKASSRIYIIANGHRSAVSGANAAKTVQAQIETFRIGEWLINRNRIDLLLPEGFFGEKGRRASVGTKKNPIDDQTLHVLLANTSRFVNAELLLHENYGIGLSQVEDRKLYRQVRDQLRSSLTPAGRLSPGLNQELEYLQKLRTVNLLQAAPVVVSAAYQKGQIATPSAMLTIGLAHLEDLITFLEAGEINIAGLQSTANAFPVQHAQLDLLDQQVSVTVIVPRTLLNQRI